jgi:hypothetical protein
VVAEGKYLNGRTHGVTGGWEKQLDGELDNTNSSPSIIIGQVKEDELAGHIARIKEKRIAYRLLVGKPERATRRNIPEDTNHHSHRRVNPNLTQ